MRKVFKSVKTIAFIALITLAGESLAKDLGKKGHSFEIKEEGFLQMIQRKLKNINLEEHQKKLTDIAKKKVAEPTPVKGITQTKENATYTYDPTFILDSDVRKPNGELIFEAGTKVNSLDNMDFNRKIFFIDERKENQVSWLEEELRKHEANKANENILPIIILVGGKPFKLSGKLNKNVYFDQHGELTTKFKIKFVPATVEQKKGEKVLIINEIVPVEK